MLTAVVGPTSDYNRSSYAIQSIGYEYFEGWAFTRSESPYRGTQP